MKKGKFIVIEGVGGAGKTEQLSQLQKKLKKEKIIFSATREPGGIKEAEFIRELIFSLKEKKLSSGDHEIALFSAARKIWIERVVAPNIEKGINVISDRTYFSTAAYQGYGEGADLKSIEKISDVFVGKYRPDLVVLLDVSLKTSLARNAANKDGDPFDYLSKAFFQRVINGYRDMAKKKWGNVNWEIVNGNQEIEKVAEDIWEIVKKVL